jgi:hypothetical protein
MGWENNSDVATRILVAHIELLVALPTLSDPAERPAN